MHKIVEAAKSRSHGFLLTQAVLIGLIAALTATPSARSQGVIMPHAPTPPCPNCQCGCTVTGQCTCRDCDHPQLTIRAVSSAVSASCPSCVNGVCSYNVMPSGQLVYLDTPSACGSGNCSGSACSTGTCSTQARPRFRIFRRRCR